jgi:hypothetical protein
MIEHSQDTASSAWVVDTAPLLPFGGRSRTVESCAPNGAITNASNATQFVTPWIDASYGTAQSQVRLVWPSAVKGKVWVKARMDKPL